MCIAFFNIGLDQDCGGHTTLFHDNRFRPMKFIIFEGLGLCYIQPFITLKIILPIFVQVIFATNPWSCYVSIHWWLTLSKRLDFFTLLWLETNSESIASVRLEQSWVHTEDHIPIRFRFYWRIFFPLLLIWYLSSRLNFWTMASLTTPKSSFSFKIGVLGNLQAIPDRGFRIRIMIGIGRSWKSYTIVFGDWSSLWKDVCCGLWNGRKFPSFNSCLNH